MQNAGDIWEVTFLNVNGGLLLQKKTILWIDICTFSLKVSQV